MDQGLCGGDRDFGGNVDQGQGVGDRGFGGKFGPRSVCNSQSSVFV